MRIHRSVVIALLPFSAACLIGCGSGGPEIAGVEGTVTMDDVPLENASVVFIPAAGVKGRPAGARTDADGHYVLTFTQGRRGAMIGKHRVQISTQADPSETPDGERIPGKPETIPKMYNSESILEFDVKPDERNVADFKLISSDDIAAADSMVQESLRK